MQRIPHLNLEPSSRTNIAIGLMFCSAAVAALPITSHSMRHRSAPSRQEATTRVHSVSARGAPSPPVWNCHETSTNVVMPSHSPRSLLSGPNIVRSEQTFLIPGPKCDVYDFLKDARNYPGCHDDVWSVQALGEGRFRWTVAIPGGCWFPYDTVVEAEGQETITCRSLPNSPVTFVGRVQCQAIRSDLTRVHVQVAYILPGLAFAEMAAAAIGTSPQEDLEWQMQRAFGGMYSKYLNRPISQSSRFTSFRD